MPFHLGAVIAWMAYIEMENFNVSAAHAALSGDTELEFDTHFQC